MKTWLRLTLVTLSVGGGFTGIALTLQMLPTAAARGGGFVAICVAFLALYAFVLVCGLLLVHNPRRTRPLLIALALQVPWVSSPIVTYHLGAGLLGMLGMTKRGFISQVRLGADWEFYLFYDRPWGVGVNVVALLFIILVLRGRHTHE